jgi:hypothetical protein
LNEKIKARPLILPSAATFMQDARDAVAQHRSCLQNIINMNILRFGIPKTGTEPGR